MADRPIIFSAPMVRALLDGRKTQTRRLATSPLRKCRTGDRLWVRETFAKAPPYGVRYAATDAINDLRKKIPSIHMPRWASRLTLIVEAVRVEPLQAISEADSVAEGIEPVETPHGPAWKSYEACPDGTPHPHASVPNRSPVISYRELWRSLHGADSWAANPEVVALTFRVERGNIDRIEG